MKIKHAVAIQCVSSYFVILLLCIAFALAGDQDIMALEQKADSLAGEARIFIGTYKYEEAVGAFKEALLTEMTLGRLGEVASILHNIGAAYFELSVCDSALFYLDSALILARKAKNEKLVCRILNKIGESHEILSYYEEALAYYDSALTTARNVGDRDTEGVILCNIGWAYDGLSDYEKALVYYDSARIVSTETSNKNLEGLILRRIGTAYSVLGHYDRAIAYYDSALTIARAEGDGKLEGRTLMGIGRVHCALHKFDEALDVNRAALVILRGIGDRVAEAYVLDCCGMAYRLLYEYDSALTYHKMALAIRRDIKDQLGEGNTLVNIGVTYDGLYQYDKALAYLDSALVITKAVKNKTGCTIIFISIGAIYDQSIRYDQALAYYDSALALARETNETMQEGSILMYIGGIYHSLRQYKTALDYYDSAQAVIKPLDFKYTEGLILMYVGAANRALEYYDEAIAKYDSSLVIMRMIKDRRMEAVVLHNIGCTYYNVHQYDKALAYLDSAIFMANETKDKLCKARVLNHTGDVYSLREQYEQALAYYNASLAIAREIRDQRTEGTTLYDVGCICEQLGDAERAISYYKESIKVKESIRETFQRVDLKTYYIEAEKDVYERLIILLVMLERYEEAFDYLERSRSQKLRKVFEQGEMVAYDPSLQRILERINFLTIEMEGLRKRFQKGEVDEATYETSIEILQGRFQQKLLDLKVYHPQLYNLMIPQHRMLRHMQAIIPDSVLFLEFLAVGNNYVVLLFTKDLFLVQSRAERRDIIDQWVMQALTSLKWQAAEEELDEVYANLYDILIEPSEQQIKRFPHVVIIPYGILHYLPFHALRRRSEEGNLEYLLEWKQVSYLPSASFLFDLLQERKPAEQTLLAFGNADGTLPSAEIEVDLIAQIFPLCNVCKCDLARKDKFIELCPDYRLIHLATHGVLDADPRFSHIVLAPPREGNLTVREILGLSGHFKLTSLITLSACETAVEADPETAGLELVTLSNAFKVAGVPTTIASLWEIADRSTAVLMEDFYKNLYRGGMEKLEALRQAQIKMLCHPDYCHPYYWAPFILIGDWR